jgi:hypothetical protein
LYNLTKKSNAPTITKNNQYFLTAKKLSLFDFLIMKPNIIVAKGSNNLNKSFISILFC